MKKWILAGLLIATVAFGEEILMDSVNYYYTNQPAYSIRLTNSSFTTWWVARIFNSYVGTPVSTQTFSRIRSFQVPNTNTIVVLTNTFYTLVNHNSHTNLPMKVPFIRDDVLLIMDNHPVGNTNRMVLERESEFWKP